MKTPTKKSNSKIKQFNAMPLRAQLQLLSFELKKCADRCSANPLTAGTWVEESFRGASDRLQTIELTLKE